MATLFSSISQYLARVKISHSLLISVVLPLMAALVLSAILVAERSSKVTEMARVKTLVEPLTMMSDLVHSLQKERGMTAVFLAAGDESFRAKLQQQRDETDQKQANVDSYLASHNFSQLDEGWAAQLEQIQVQFGLREDIRAQVDRRAISRADALSYYTGTNLMVLELIKYTAQLGQDLEVASMINAFAYYLQAKERVGIERAVGASGYARGKFSFEDLRQLDRLITLQRTYFREFRELAAPEHVAALDAALGSLSATTVQHMRDRAFAGGMEGELGDYTADQFFQAQTEKIDLLRQGELHLTQALVNMAENLESRARNQRMLLLSTTALFFIAMAGLSALFMRGITCSINQVVRNAETMAKGNLEIELPPPNANEIGRINAALAVFRDSIVKSCAIEEEARKKEIALREERERAKEQEMAKKAAHEAEERRKAEEIHQRERQAAMEIAEVVQYCGSGDFSQRLRVDDKDGIFAEICRGVNRIAEVTQVNLGHVQKALAALKEGNVNHRMEGEFSGVFANIQEDLNAAFEALTLVISQIEKNSESLQTSTHEISDASINLAKRTETSAATLEEITASITELSKSVRMAAELAQEADSSILDIERVAENGAEIVDKTIAAILGVRDSSETIDQTISIIDEIAFQTNLLALNAGVEAARAGEQGRGFAVVASEVRDLATRSSEAAQTISALVEQNQKQVARGVEMVNKTGAALKQIAHEVSDISKRVREIASSVSQQSNSIDEIRTATSQLDQVTQENAAMFEETTALNTALKAETDRLVEVLSMFHSGGVEVTSDKIAGWDEDAREAS